MSEFNDLIRRISIASPAMQTLSVFFEKELVAGIQSPAPSCSLDVSPTFVTQTAPVDPQGGDASSSFSFASGTFLGVDVGGTHCRVLRCVVSRGSEDAATHLETTHVFKTVIADRLRRGVGGTELFDFIVQSIQQALQPDDEGKSIPMGLSFSFGVRATAIDHGILYACGKEWNMKEINESEFFGRDVSELINEALVRCQMSQRVRLVALLNDTVGTLISGFFDDPQTSVGVILGTGTNMCLWDDIKTIAKLSDEYRKKNEGRVMVTNTEWGSIADPKFDPKSPINDALCPVDHIIDAESMVPGDRMFEKMISGMYLGEITRLLLVDASKSGRLESKLPSKLLDKSSLSSPDVSVILSDQPPSFSSIESLLKSNFGWGDSTAKDRLLIRQIAEAVVTRAGRLIAAGLAAVYRYLKRPNGGYLALRKDTKMVVAVEGSVYEKLDWCRKAIDEGLRELLGQEVSVELKLVNDGSGRGAALLASLCVGGGH